MIFQHEKHSFFPKLRSPVQKLLKTSYLVFRGGVALFKGLPITILLLFAMQCFAPEAAFGQQGGPGTAWTTGVNFESNAPCNEDTWSFDAAEMSNGDLVTVGYTATHVTDCSNPNKTRVPAYCVTDKFGALKSSFYYNGLGAGGFNRITKSLDGGVILAGWQSDKAPLVKLDQNYSEVWQKRFDIPSNSMNPGVERLYSVEVLPNGNILLSGGFKGGPPDQGSTFFTIRDSNGNFIDTNNDNVDND